jgi:hypothetical protein
MSDAENLAPPAPDELGVGSVMNWLDSEIRHAEGWQKMVCTIPLDIAKSALDAMSKLSRERDEARAKLAEMERDAARYRWWRDNSYAEDWEAAQLEDDLDKYTDAQIAALAAQPTEDRHGP